MMIYKNNELTLGALHVLLAGDVVDGFTGAGVGSTASLGQRRARLITHRSLTLSQATTVST